MRGKLYLDIPIGLLKPQCVYVVGMVLSWEGEDGNSALS